MYFDQRRTYGVGAEPKPGIKLLKPGGVPKGETRIDLGTFEGHVNQPAPVINTGGGSTLPGATAGQGWIPYVPQMPSFVGFRGRDDQNPHGECNAANEGKFFQWFPLELLASGCSYIGFGGGPCGSGTRVECRSGQWMKQVAAIPVATSPRGAFDLKRPCSVRGERRFQSNQCFQAPCPQGPEEECVDGFWTLRPASKPFTDIGGGPTIPYNDANNPFSNLAERDTYEACLDTWEKQFKKDNANRQPTMEELQAVKARCMTSIKSKPSGGIAPLALVVLALKFLI